MGLIDNAGVDDSFGSDLNKFLIGEHLEAVGNARWGCVGTREVGKELLLGGNEVGRDIVNLASRRLRGRLGIDAKYMVIV